jgi:tetratricopeptide (TPR) repeat protein
MKSKVFVGSSIEGLPIAYAVQQNLRYSAEVTVWDQGVFNLSESALESLQEVLSNSDFGVFVLSPDDVLKIRGKENVAVRDNVVFELGLFIGKLGKKRCFMLIPDKNAEIHLPTDLVGMTPGTYETERSDGSFQRGSGPACHDIRGAIEKVGPIFNSKATPETSPVLEVTHNQQETQQINQPDKNIDKKPEVVSKASDWVELFLEKKHKDAVKVLKANLGKTKKKNDKIEISAQIALVEFDQDSKKGQEEFERLLLADPKNVGVYMFYSFGYLRHELYQECINIVERGIANVGGVPRLILRKVNCLCEMGKSIDAIPLLTQGITNHLTEPDLYEELTKIYLAADNKIEARKILIAGLKHLPENQTLLGQYGRLLNDLKEHDSAMLVFERLRELNDKDAQCWTLLGNQYLLLNFYDLAWAAYKKGKELSAKENSGWISGNIGNLLNNKGLFQAGEEFLREGIAIEPSSEYIHSRLSDALKGQQTEKEKAEKVRKEARQKYLSVPLPADAVKI